MKKALNTDQSSQPAKINNNPFAKKVEQVAEPVVQKQQQPPTNTFNPVNNEPKKLVTPSVFGNAPKQAEEKPIVKEAPKKLEIIKHQEEVVKEPIKVQPPAPIQAPAATKAPGFVP